MKPVHIQNFKWEGHWLFFKIKTRCGECDTNTAILMDMLKKEFKNKPVSLEVKPWLNNWFFCLLKGGWHAPIIFINGKLFSQGILVQRTELTQAVKKELCS